MFLQTITFMMVAGFVAMTSDHALAQVLEVSDQVAFPRINLQPEDQSICLGSNITFTVKAENGDSYQWARNGVAIEGQTKSTLTIEKARVEDVGLYTCYVMKDAEVVPSRSASLTVFTLLSGGGSSIVLFGTPISSSGSSGTCPGSYVGYVNYKKTVAQGWGWSPTAGVTLHTATDTNRTNTKVEYVGSFGDSGCNPTTVTVPDPTASPKYRFSIYFTNNVPTNPYSIILDGFDP